MKRTLALAILGIAAVAVNNASGQGTIRFSNYGLIGGSYFPIKYSTALGGANVAAAQGVQIQLWGAAGAGLAAGSLNLIGNANLSGFAGYTDPNQVFVVAPAPYTSGAEWTLQLRATGTRSGQPVTGAGLLVTTALADQDGPLPPATPALLLTPGFTVAVVPEPSTFALAGLGAAALLIFRRRA
jgi:hypothetical protein